MAIRWVLSKHNLKIVFQTIDRGKSYSSTNYFFARLSKGGGGAPSVFFEPLLLEGEHSKQVHY